MLLVITSQYFARFLKIDKQLIMNTYNLRVNFYFSIFWNPFRNMDFHAKNKISHLVSKNWGFPKMKKLVGQQFANSIGNF